MFARGTARASFTLFAVLMLTVAGCDKDSDCLECPTVGTSGIAGRITGVGGVPLNATIEARGVGRFGAFASGQTDATGSYDFSLPAGSYVVRVSILDSFCNCARGFVDDGSLTTNRDRIDTLRVSAASGRLRADVSLGGAVVEVTASEEWEGMDLGAELRAEEMSAWTSNYHIASGRTEVRFPAVIPGTYSLLLLTGSDYASALGESLAIRAGVETRVETTLLPPAILTGTITGAWQSLGTRPPRVSIFDSDSTRVASTSTDSEGNFTLRTYGMQARLLVSIDNVERWYGGNTYEEATVFDLRPGETSHVTLRDSGIAGTVVRAGTIDYVSIELVGPGHAGIVYASFANSFRFVNLSPGTYTLHIFRGTAWCEQWYDRAFSREEATPLIIDAEGQVKWARLELEEGAHIRGHVVDRTDQPILMANTILTTTTSSAALEDRGYSSPDGAFEVGGLSDGDYKLGVRRDSGPTTWYPGSTSWDSAGVITIVNLEDVDGITLRLQE